MYRFSFHDLKVHAWWPNKQFFLAQIEFEHPVLTIFSLWSSIEFRLGRRCVTEQTDLGLDSNVPKVCCSSLGTSLVTSISIDTSPEETLWATIGSRKFSKHWTLLTWSTQTAVWFFFGNLSSWYFRATVCQGNRSFSWLFNMFEIGVLKSSQVSNLVESRGSPS